MCHCQKLAVFFHVKAYKYLPCAAQTFTIHHKHAELDDFGETYDADIKHASDCGCGCRKFKAYRAKKEVLEKYGITKEEYKQITDALKLKFDVGHCGLCE